MHRVIFAGFLLCLFATASYGEPLHIGAPTTGYTYFNRPGATFDAHNEDLHACIAATAHMGDQPMDMGIVGDAVQAWLARGIHPSVIENCMIVRGWRVVRLSDNEGRELTALPRDQLASHLQQIVGSTEIHGAIVRYWNNDAANGTNRRHEMGTPAVTRNGSLSVLALDNTSIDGASAEARVQYGRAMRASSVEPLAAGQGAIVIQLKGLSAENSNGFLLSRLSADGALMPPVRGEPNALVAQQNLLANNREGNWIVLRAPAGRWVISSFTFLNLCFGGPAFTVEPGEVVYAGTFDFSSEHLDPDLDLAAPRQWLAPHPALVGALKAADYTNGWTTPCQGGSSAYALEFQGRPFREGYAWGSRAAQDESQ